MYILQIIIVSEPAAHADNPQVNGFAEQYVAKEEGVALVQGEASYWNGRARYCLLRSEEI